MSTVFMVVTRVEVPDEWSTSTVMVDGVRIADAFRTHYNPESGLHLRASTHERSTLRSHRVAAAAHRVLEGHQRRRPMGGPLLRVRPAELLCSARGTLSARRRR